MAGFDKHIESSWLNRLLVCINTVVLPLILFIFVINQTPIKTVKLYDKQPNFQVGRSCRMNLSG